MNANHKLVCTPSIGLLMLVGLAIAATAQAQFGGGGGGFGDQGAGIRGGRFARRNAASARRASA